ncbi:hypothetical protein BOTBODRAFT_241726 [Botryobasidium botryosum FD-172 SS1]|uniref:DUF6533 domain-containing protein n=1 Tax=Botryobasidium botryosum (strain FD-172 SS1) TaxID=930990 RepID=A0A067MQ83_BOTB1|nr:hypothetical protein BOTBODRAFT_241726 [Botryobasidium botryosum FD-172 SS1]
MRRQWLSTMVSVHYHIAPELAPLNSRLGETPPVAALVVLTYDHALTLNEEIRLIWGASWNLAKVLFLFIRYVTPAAMVILLATETQTTISFEITCRLDPMFFLATYGLTEGATSLLVLLRVHAIWGREQKVLITMGSALAMIMTFFTITYVEVGMTIIDVPGEDPIYCYGVNDFVTKFVFTSFVLTLAFDVIALVLMLLRAVMHHRARQIREPLLQRFYAYGVGYSAGLILLRVFLFIGDARLDLVVFKIAMHFVRCLSVTLTTRMYLSIRSMRTYQDWAAATDVKPRGGAEVTGDSTEMSVISISRRHCVPPV